jgi:drug/metabolite transporter (DMT)-like permease
MNATGTFFSVLLAHFIYKNDRLSWHKVIGCTVGFIGVMVVNFNQGLLDFHFTLLGEGFVVIAALILSAASIYGRQISQTMDSIVLTGYQLTIGGVVLILGGYGAVACWRALPFSQARYWLILHCCRLWPLPSGPSCSNTTGLAW